jgi:quercetin dioxygenase-like cupin family protein
MIRREEFMSLRFLLVVFSIAAIALAQSGSKAVIINQDTAEWKGGEKEGSVAGVALRQVPALGATDIMVRFPPGHVIAPHFHDSNERVIVIEGEMTLAREDGDAIIKPGGFAFLPAGEIQRLRCSSKTRCTVYLGWDGKPDSHPAK